MSLVSIREEYLKNIADAIRDKTGTTQPLTTDVMAPAIMSIDASGSGADLSNYYTKLETELILENYATKEYVDQVAANGGGGGGEYIPREDVSHWFDENGARPVFDEDSGMFKVELPGFDFNGNDWIGTNLNYDIVCEGNGERKEERDQDWAVVWTEPDNHHLCDFDILGENYSNQVRIHEGSLYAENFPADFVIYELIIFKPEEYHEGDDGEEYVTYDYINNDLMPRIEEMIAENSGGGAVTRVDNYRWSSDEPLTAERNPDIENYFTLQLPDFPEGLEGSKKYEIVCEGDGERKEEFEKDWANVDCTPDGIALYDFSILGDNYGEAAILPGGMLVMSNVPEDFRLYEFNIYTLERSEPATVDMVNDLAARIEALENTPNAEEGLY